MSNTQTKIAVLVVAAQVLAGNGGHARSSNIDWFSVDGGGSTSTGGDFSVSGTIGQPDAGTMAGGSFYLVSGFWPGVTVSPSIPGPVLAITRFAASVVISWTPATPGFVLQVNDSLSPATWIEAPSGSSNPVSVPSGGPAKFYRLRKQ